MRVAIGAVWHETLSFAHTRTELSDFERFQFSEGADVIARNRGVANEVGGFLSAADELPMEVVPLLFAGALPSPTVSAKAWSHIVTRFLDRLRAAMPLDGVLLALHGAMSCEEAVDPEAELLQEVRRVVGEATPLVVTLDLHANVSEETFRSVTVLIAYDTYPHVDIFDRGVEAAHVLGSLLAKQRVSGAFRKLPLLTTPLEQSTEDGPLRRVMAHVQELERDKRVVAISVCPGYPYSDVARLGATVTAYTRGDQALADSLASEVANHLWSLRADFPVPAVPVQQAVADAIASSEFPVILVDAADNIGGGTPGDGTCILAELLAQKAQGAVVTIADREAVAQCFEARPGDIVRLLVGGRYDRNHGDPVRLEGKLRLLSDGVYCHAGSYMTGLRVEMGRTAVVASGGVDVVIMERKAMPFDAEQLRCVGISPQRQRIIAVKSAIAWKAAYGDMAKKVSAVDTPGLCSSNLSLFTYTNRPRPMWPLEPASYHA
jgi:microcystin degradation protein MlrC